MGIPIGFPSQFIVHGSPGGRGGGATPYNDFMGRLRLKGYLFHASGIRKFRDLTSESVESVISVCKLAQKGCTGENVE